jgi:chromosome transmission fidelity protein 1
MQIVTLPYPLLLQKFSREALGIDLTNHVVIIDEAHNLIETISALHSTTLSHAQILLAKQQLEIYLGKFTNRLSGTNKMFIKQILALLRSLDAFLATKRGSSGQIPPGELLSSSGGALDQINFHKVEKYLKQSSLARKVDGYYTRENDSESGNSPVLLTLQSFLGGLNNPSREGRLFFSPTEDSGEMTFKYLLLDVSHLFAEIVSSARAVVLAGGTMAPLQSYINALFPTLKDRVQVHSFPHIIPAENLCVATLSRGPSGKELLFDFKRRADKDVMEELGRTILGLTNVVKSGGIIIFVPSYAYLDTLFKVWSTIILPKLAAKRKVSA